MALVDPEREPPDAIVDHPKSKRRYQVLRKNGKLLHRESLLSQGAEEVVLSEYPAKYVVGSRHSRTYLADADGFLVESPITWYVSKKGWDMSPDYDRENQPGFQRPIGERCMSCHAGMSHAVGGSPQKIEFKELGISCERCHGPGELHVARHAAPLAAERELSPVDDTIVNPAHLPRGLAESICADCHLDSSAFVVARGRKLSDFRPGLPLQDVRHDFGLNTGDKFMTVVGHVEQMRMSRCYQRSETFSCLTCHDPHAEPSPWRRDRHYQRICLQCHQTEACKVDPAERHKQNPGNQCTYCHMPRSGTEVPHLAYTHHKVGIHDLATIGTTAKTKPTSATKLTPLFDLSRLSEIDRQRSLGLGYIQVANLCETPALAKQFRGQAEGLLMKTRSQGLRDGVVDAALAELCADLSHDGIIPLAEAAYSDESLAPWQRCNSLFFWAAGLAQAGKIKEAVPKLHELTTLRRQTGQLLLLAQCQQSLKDHNYIQSLEAAVCINPRLWKVQEHLAEHYRRAGDSAKAEYHQKRAMP